jgi:hypothetical protein
LFLTNKNWKQAPHVFRFFEEPGKIIISQKVLDAFIELGQLNNINCSKLEQNNADFIEAIYRIENYTNPDIYTVISENDGTGNYFLWYFLKEGIKFMKAKPSTNQKKKAKDSGEKWLTENADILDTITLDANEIFNNTKKIISSKFKLVSKSTFV